jgi:hypothetical protein
MERQLSQLQRRSRDVLGHKLILHPAASALRRLGQMLLANIHRIQDIGRRNVVAGAASDTAVPLIPELIQSSHRLLDHIVAQIALCDSTTRETLAVADWGRRLTRQEPLKLYRLLPLFDRICDEIRRVGELQMLLPMPGLPLAALVESQSGQTETANFVGGVTTARVLVWMLGDDQRQAHFLPRLVLAALLQDVGRLAVNAGGLSTRMLPGHKSDWLEEQHPTMGAAMFGSIRGAPIELPMLVAQHHEQLDGGGFPRALAARDILPESAILATASRFAELCLMPPGALAVGDHSPMESADPRIGKSSAARAVDALVSEAEWGKWPLDFSRFIAQRVAEAEAIDHLQLPDVGEVGTAEVVLRAQSTADSRAGDRTRQLHAHEQNLQGTHTDHAGRHAGTIVRDGKAQFDNG